MKLICLTSVHGAEIWIKPEDINLMIRAEVRNGNFQGPATAVHARRHIADAVLHWRPFIVRETPEHIMTMAQKLDTPEGETERAEQAPE